MADIIDLIYADHDWLRRQFFRLDDAKSKDELAAVWNVLSMRLDAHADAEETVFYPAIAKKEDLKDMVAESLEEHKQVKTLLREMESLASDSEKFEPKLKVLMENVEHHAVEEEEGKMFPKIRKIMNAASLEKLGKALEAAKPKNLRKAS